MARVLVFDVNETLLDLGGLDRHFERMFGDVAVRREWFGLVLRNALALTITGDYEDFVAIGGASLEMVAQAHGVELDEADRAGVSGAMVALPPHPDVIPSLERLRKAGLRMAALTNSPPQTAVAQLTSARVAGFFERIMSVAPTRRYKPHPAVYELAARELGVATPDLWMVAAHDWDVAGAMGAGCAGAYVVRPGMAPNPLFPAPEVVGSDLHEVVDRILAIELGEAE